MADRITAAQFAALDLPDWRVVVDAAETAFHCGSFARAGACVAEMADLCDRRHHHANVDLRYPDIVHVRTTTHDVGGLSSRDVELAGEISALAAAHGYRVELQGCQSVDIAIDALDITAVRPFWRAVLGYGSEDVIDDDAALVDGTGRGPTVWFQQMDAPRPQRNRIHLDVNVPAEVAEQRVADTIAAGGVLITDEYTPSFWVLGDPEGNEACVCTWQSARVG
ncbi:MAG: VOC family protein [Candidatus Nanopelagicales bacterium]